MRTPAIVITLMVAATAGTFAALVLGMGAPPGGGAARAAPPVTESNAPEPELANMAAAPAPGEEGQAPADAAAPQPPVDADEPAPPADADAPAPPTPAPAPGGAIEAKLASLPVFIKGENVTWAEVKDSIHSSSMQATEAYAACLNEQGIDRRELPETGVVDLKFEGGGQPKRIQVFGAQFVASPTAFKCFKRSLQDVSWQADGDMKVRFRLAFEYG